MNIKLNDKEFSLPSENLSLGNFLKDQNQHYDTGVALAVNDQIVPRQQWEDYLLKPNDNILIITAVQGG
ncbi:MAG: sulfur carrier protein ThiS [Cytophagales bacterium]|nr:sulfur carrier protein ThiS [Cytophagales bacterium]